MAIKLHKCGSIHLETNKVKLKYFLTYINRKYIYFYIYLIFLFIPCQNIYLHKYSQFSEFKMYVFSCCSRPGGELNAGEDEVEGLKRLLTEVTVSTTPYAALQAG